MKYTTDTLYVVINKYGYCAGDIFTTKEEAQAQSEDPNWTYHPDGYKVITLEEWIEHRVDHALDAVYDSFGGA